MRKELSLIFCEDITYLANRWKEEVCLKNSTIFITGATGLIGSVLTKAFLMLNELYDFNIKLVLLVRNREKAGQLFQSYKSYNMITLLVNDICTLDDIPDNVDYIFHCASNTNSKSMVMKPVETIETIVIGTRNILNIAKKLQVKSMVFLSSMEVYGKVDNLTTRVTENQLGEIDILNERSSYSEGKRIAECLCYSYFKEYKVPVKIARLAQTFGPGISLEDNRIFSQFAKSVIKKENIELHTRGNSIGNYCYITDCLQGLLCLLLKGINGEAYNIVNEDSSMAIRDVAELVIDRFALSTNKVVYKLNNNNCYAPETKLRLSSKKLNDLGWSPTRTLEDSYRRLIQYIKEVQDKDKGIE